MDRAEALAVLTLSGLVVLGCQGPGPGHTRDPVLDIGLAGRPSSLDPHLQNDWYALAVLSNIYDELVRVDSDMRLQPALARSWENPDERTWRFHLRPGAIFHDGSPLTSEDVRFSFERARHLAGTRTAAYLAPVERVEVLDEHTLDLVTREPHASLIVKLAKLAIVPQGSPDEIVRPVGTGPYRFLARPSDEVIELQSFPGHWQGPPPFPRVRFHAIPSTRTRLTALLEGDMDLVSGLPVSQAQDLEDHPRVRPVSSPGIGVTYLQLRPDRPPFDDRRVREAVDLALDRQALVDVILGGQGLPLGQMSSPYSFGYVPDMKPRGRDLARAVELLKEVGEKAQVPIVLEHREDRLATPIRDQMREAGFLVETMPRPWDEMYERLNRGDPTFYLGNWITTLGTTSELFESKVHSVDPERGFGDSNSMGYRNPALDALIEEGSEAVSADRRRVVLERAMRMLMDDRVLLPLFLQNELYGASQTIRWTPRMDTRILARDIQPAE